MLKKLPPSDVDLESKVKFELNLVKTTLTVLNERMANKFAIIVENPGARHDWAMKPSFNSAKHMTSSPCFQSHDGMFSKYACKEGNVIYWDMAGSDRGLVSQSGSMCWCQIAEICLTTLLNCILPAKLKFC